MCSPRHTIRITNYIQRPTKHHVHHFCHYHMAIPSQFPQTRDTILYDTRIHIQHPKK